MQSAKDLETCGYFIGLTRQTIEELADFRKKSKKKLAKATLWGITGKQ